MDTIFFFSLSVDGHLGCLHFLAIVNNAVNNICVRDFVWTYIFISLGQLPRSGIAGLYGDSVSEELPNCFPKRLHHFTVSPAI